MQSVEGFHEVTCSSALRWRCLAVLVEKPIGGVVRCSDLLCQPRLPKDHGAMGVGPLIEDKLKPGDFPLVFNSLQKEFAALSVAFEIQI
jgi:hypothetical protein